MPEFEPVREGRLLKLRLERSMASRADALASIRPLPSGFWSVRIGGRMRGKTKQLVSRRACEAAVKQHYDAALLAFVRSRRRS